MIDMYSKCHSIQGNLGAKKIARSRFQSPVKKKKSQIATLATDSAIPACKQKS
jgi:hypothetical protein